MVQENQVGGSKDKSQRLSYGALVLNGTAQQHLAGSEDLILIHTKTGLVLVALEITISSQHPHHAIKTG